MVSKQARTFVSKGAIVHSVGKETRWLPIGKSSSKSRRGKGDITYIVVCSALVSYAGATSTISAPMKLTPSNPRRMVRNSRVDQPPVSGVPVAGATVLHLLIPTFLYCQYEDDYLSCPFLGLTQWMNDQDWCKLTGRVESINVNWEIYWIDGANSLTDFFDDATNS